MKIEVTKMIFGWNAMVEDGPCKGFWSTHTSLEKAVQNLLRRKEIRKQLKEGK